jgi:hypothetical protein
MKAFQTILLAASALTSAALASNDLLIADFEGKDFGTWTTTGDAFGTGPARGASPGMPPVSEMVGRGFAGSGTHGDSATGTLTSPAFSIERNYLRFYLGGGSFPGKTCLNLLVDGKVVRTASPPSRLIPPRSKPARLASRAPGLPRRSMLSRPWMPGSPLPFPERRTTPPDCWLPPSSTG